MSKPVNQTKHSKGYHRTAVRHRGYGRRRLFLVRPRPGQPGYIAFYQPDATGPLSCSALLLPGARWYCINSQTPDWAAIFSGQPDVWNFFNANFWTFPCPQSSDWRNPGAADALIRMLVPPPSGQVPSTVFNWT
jgi:hypothetical protein